MYSWQKKRRGSSSRGLPPPSFINFIQNHDQIANFGNGLRIHDLSDFKKVKAITGLYLLAPGIPMLFQGQEFISSTRFCYFGDHKSDLAERMAEGRKRELAQFSSQRLPEIQKSFFHPGEEETFTMCKLDHEERNNGKHEAMYRLHRDLLGIRKTLPALRKSQRANTIEGAVLSGEVLAIKFFGEKENDDLLLLSNLGIDFRPEVLPEPLLGAPRGQKWSVHWSSENSEYLGLGTPSIETADFNGAIKWNIPAQTTVLLKLRELSSSERDKETIASEEHEKQKKKRIEDELR